ncbi:MAG: exonuclease domain-containing protein [Coprobacillus sp.]
MYNNQSFKRGIYTKKLIQDYCVLDLETTGLSPINDMIIEVGILKIRDGQIVDKYTQLINPEREISYFITKLTGITNQMVQYMPPIYAIKYEVLDFIRDDIIIGHNTAFDLSFIANKFDMDIENEYMDTVQFSRKVYPKMKHHRLTDMVELLDLSNNEHRAIADCIATHELYEHLKQMIIDHQIKL